MSTLIPWRSRTIPRPGFEAMERRLGRLLETPFGGEEPLGWNPPVDFVEADGEYVLSVELPGMKKDDVAVEVEDDRLVLRGEKKEEKERKGARWHLYERSYGSFERSFTLPRSVETADVKADFEDGVLTVHLPKREEARGRRVEIGRK